MPNNKPVAGDVYQPWFVLNEPAVGNILDNTDSFDVDGDRVRLNFVNGQRVTQPTSADDPPIATVIEGRYGTLTIQSDGQYSYALDYSKPEVAALGPGSELRETFSFKISDGKGATDFGVLNIAYDLPERGEFVVDFEDVRNTDFPTGYKGFDWGAWNDGDDAYIGTSAGGDHFLGGGAFWTPLRSVDGGLFQVLGFNVANGTSEYDNVLTITGESEGGAFFQTEILITADSIDAPQYVDLSALGFTGISSLVLDTEPVPGEGGPNWFGAIYDDFRFIVG